MSEENNEPKQERGQPAAGEGDSAGQDEGPAPSGQPPVSGRTGGGKDAGQEHHHRLKKKELEEELETVLSERNELKDKYLRALADAENQRKRWERERSEFFQFALTETLKDLLGVLDSLERAMDSESRPESRGFLEGMRMIQKQFLDVLARRGVTPILDVVGGPFDPNLHQALTTVEDAQVEEPRVAEELQRGYKIHDRLLRPSLVKVAVPRREP